MLNLLSSWEVTRSKGAESLEGGSSKGEEALLRKIARRRAWRCFRYKDMDHNLRTEHECILLRLPRTMVSMVMFT
jgi:hypothetical protein